MSYRDLDFRIDLSLDTVHSRIVALVGSDKDVLELGCASGYMSRALAENGCRVTGIELSEEAARRAERFCRRVVVSDLDTIDFARQLEGESFDVILCADVLEHLRNPERALAELGRFVRPDTYLVASVPNISHVSVVVELLEGRFRYRSDGLLDESHLRFFTHDSLYELFEGAGWVISHLDRFRLEPEVTELRTDLSRFTPEVVEALTTHPESKTYQFVVRAHFAGEERGSTRLRNLVGRAEAAEGSERKSPSPLARETVDALFSRMQFLEDDRIWHTREIEGVRRDFIELKHHVKALELDARSKTEALEAERDAARAELERLRASRAYRFASKLGRLWAKVFSRD